MVSVPFGTSAAALHVFVPREFHRGFSRGPRLLSDRFIDGHQLRTIEDSLDGGEICVLTRNQHSARPALVFERLDRAAGNRVIRGNYRCGSSLGDDRARVACLVAEHRL